MRDRQHYQFSLGGDKHLWWCRVGMGFKHERCNGDIQHSRCGIGWENCWALIGRMDWLELEEKVVWRCGKLATLQRHGVNVALMSLFLSKVSNHHEDQFLLALMRQRLARGMLLRSENVPLQRSFRHGTTRDAAGWRRILLCYVYCAYRGRWRWLEM